MMRVTDERSIRMYYRDGDGSERLVTEYAAIADKQADPMQDHIAEALSESVA